MIESKIKRQFIKEVLTEESKLMQQAHQSAIKQYSLIDTRTLVTGIEMTVSASDADGILTEKHKIYQRFLDMKKNKNGKKKKSFAIHNRIVWGHFGTIAYKLMYYLTEDVVARIKKDLET